MIHSLVTCISENRIQRAIRYLGSIAGSGFEYPWENLYTQQAGSARIFLIGYGSLLNAASAARTITSTPPLGHPPVVAFGARRVFNYRMPKSAISRYGLPASDRECAALNAEWTRCSDHILNGRLIPIEPGDIAELRKREQGYDLRPVSCLRWDTNDEPFVAYVLCCSSISPHGQELVDESILPYAPYYGICRAGAAAVSRAFLDLFLATTFLADRKTTMGQWELQRSTAPR